MNAIFVLIHKEIKHIPKQKNITYAHLLINFWLQKSDPIKFG